MLDVSVSDKWSVGTAGLVESVAKSARTNNGGEYFTTYPVK